MSNTYNLKIISQILVYAQTQFRNNRLIKQNPGLKQLIKYSIVGNISNIIDFGLYVYLTRIFSFWHEHYLIANIFTMFIASLIRFTWHKKWTFRDHGRQIEFQYLKFVIVLVVSSAINESILYLLVEHFIINDLLGKFIAVCLTTLVAYFGTKKWVFDSKNSDNY